MASLTIRNLDDEVKSELRVRAARNGRSMEDEARVILGEAVRPAARDMKRILAAIRAPLVEVGHVDFEIPARDSIAEPPNFLEDADLDG